MDTVLRHALISLKMANEEYVLIDLSENVIKISLHQSGKEIKLGQGDGLTFLSICLRKASVYRTYLAKTITCKVKRDKAYEKIQKELDIPITEIKNKRIGLRLLADASINNVTKFRIVNQLDQSVEVDHQNTITPCYKRRRSLNLLFAQFYPLQLQRLSVRQVPGWPTFMVCPKHTRKS